MFAVAELASLICRSVPCHELPYIVILDHQERDVTYPTPEPSSGAFDSPGSTSESPLDRRRSHPGCRDWLPRKGATHPRRGDGCLPTGAAKLATRHDSGCVNGGKIAGRGQKSCGGPGSGGVG